MLKTSQSAPDPSSSPFPILFVIRNEKCVLKFSDNFIGSDNIAYPFLCHVPLISCSSESGTAFNSAALLPSVNAERSLKFLYSTVSEKESSGATAKRIIAKIIFLISTPLLYKIEKPSHPFGQPGFQVRNARDFHFCLCRFFKIDLLQRTIHFAQVIIGLVVAPDLLFH